MVGAAKTVGTGKPLQERTLEIVGHTREDALVSNAVGSATSQQSSHQSHPSTVRIAVPNVTSSGERLFFCMQIAGKVDEHGNCR